MGERWVIFLLVVLALLPLAVAHKNPVIEYTYVSHIWEESYTTIPRQPVVNERIVFKAAVVHPNERIEGNVTATFSIYEDNTAWDWYGGKAYMDPGWILIKEAPGQPTDEHHEFIQDAIFDRPGSYQVFIQWHEDEQYIGQSMHTLDVERRTIGPMFVVFNVLLVLAVVFGVWRGIL